MCDWARLDHTTVAATMRDDEYADILPMNPIEGVDTFKCIMLGEFGAGKTTLLDRIMKDKDNQQQKQSTKQDSDIRTRNVLVKSGLRSTLHLWDTAGMERLHSLTYSYYRDAKAVLLVYDSETKEKVKAHLKELVFQFAGTGGAVGGSGLDPSILVFLLANKIDEGRDFAYSESEVANLSSHTKVRIADHFQVSGETGEGVEEALRTIAERLLETRQETTRKEAPDSKKDTVKLGSEEIKPPPKKRLNCSLF